MKTCLIITRFADDQPGFLDFSYRIKALEGRYRLVIVSSRKLSQPELQIDKAEYVVIPHKNTKLGELLFFLNCAHLIRSRHPDIVVLLHSAVSPITTLVRRIPTVLYWNEHPSHFFSPRNSVTPFRNLVRGLLLRLYYLGARKAALVMPIGEAHRDELLGKGVDPHRLSMFYMGVHPMFHALSEGQQSCPDGKVRLIYTGSVMRERGRDVMLEALAQANRNGSIATLTLVGASPDQVEYCLTRAKELGIEGDVDVHGRVPGYEIPGFLQKADAGICVWEDRPYWRFNPPTKLFEYLVAGLPVLASNIRTHTQYVSDWDNGLIFEYDGNSLAKAIRDLWDGRSKLTELKHNALKSGTQYLWGNIEPAFLNAIESLGPT